MAATKGPMKEEGARKGNAPSPPPAFLVTFFAVLLAGVVLILAPGALGWAGVGAVALVGAYFASRTSSSKRGFIDASKARRLLLLLDRGGSAECKVPSEFVEEWGTLYERVNRLAFDAKSSSRPLAELEKFRKQADLAASYLSQGKNPLSEAPELRSGPLEPLLEGLKGSSSMPVVSHMTLGEEELIGSDGDTLPDNWPKPSDEPRAKAPVVDAAFESGLRELVREIEALRGTLAGGREGDAPPASSEDPAIRTPAQLVDAVVLTAADGIEDLAAGLMRANELASVAERVTNRATLLALNAALEATRSGSEAFASIAEETRRLAEFAREATDTISRLSSEIEYKVGETITAIHATSEDAKNSLAELSGMAVPVPNAARNARLQVVRLLERSRGLLASLGPRGGQGPAEAPPDSRPEPPSWNLTQDNVENDRPSADNLPLEGILLIEGLKPGANLES